MDHSQEFFPRQELDRTPTGACALVGAAVLIFFLTGAILLWHAAAAVKRHHYSFKVGLPSLSVPSVSLPTDLGQQVKDAAGQAAQKAADQAAQQAADKIKQQAGQGLHQEQDRLQDQIKNNL